MLACQDFCRHHERPLITGATHRKQGGGGDSGFAGADISLYQTVHHRPRSKISAKIIAYFLLSSCQGKGQIPLEFDQGCARIKRIEGSFFAQRLLQTTHGIEKAKKAVKYDALSGSGEVFHVARRMNFSHCYIFREKAVAFPKGRRKPVRNRWRYRKSLFHQSPKGFLADSFWQCVLGNGAMQQFFVLLSCEELRLL